MKFDDLYKKVIDSCRAFKERQVPIRLDFKIEDLRDALVESNDTIEKLKQKLEDAKATAYADSVDAGMRERRLRRLLWHAIALFCTRSCEYFNGIMSHCLMGQDDLYRRCEEKKNKYLNAMYKCRAMAEKFGG